MFTFSDMHVPLKSRMLISPFSPIMGWVRGDRVLVYPWDAVPSNHCRVTRSNRYFVCIKSHKVVRGWFYSTHARSVGLFPQFLRRKWRFSDSVLA